MKKTAVMRCITDLMDKITVASEGAKCQRTMAEYRHSEGHGEFCVRHHSRSGYPFPTTMKLPNEERTLILKSQSPASMRLILNACVFCPNATASRAFSEVIMNATRTSLIIISLISLLVKLKTHETHNSPTHETHQNA
ncbi:hypothetical protein EDD18DRAFT_1111338 [Armillaria luteobubalina]|uniref:Uncharacterized protein n=1 Tax=Armillaria luteobubalina TaxID=153913 RepID=A0AA39PJQ4_9AGAR|nr:hypothetical protein EDD18DRAFT_1111338 [Armillaria luteobubalina]